jgi:DNA-binding LacI/PurR family transcriptional regulator
LCPTALSVVGIDNVDVSAYIVPALTSVHLPVSRISELAANCLLDELAGKGVKSIAELPAELMCENRRESWAEVPSQE